jgi:transposase
VAAFSPHPSSPRGGAHQGELPLSARYVGIKGRWGSKKAAVAVGHSILVICYHIMERKEPYEEFGEEHYRNKQQRCSKEAYTKRLVRKLERLGHKVALEPLVGCT